MVKSNLFGKVKEYNEVALRAGRGVPKNPMSFMEKIKKIIASEIAKFSAFINDIIETLQGIDQRVIAIEELIEENAEGPDELPLE